MGILWQKLELGGKYGRELWKVLHKSKQGYGPGLCLEFWFLYQSPPKSSLLKTKVGPKLTCLDLRLFNFPYSVGTILL